MRQVSLLSSTPKGAHAESNMAAPVTSAVIKASFIYGLSEQKFLAGGQFLLWTSTPVRSPNETGFELRVWKPIERDLTISELTPFMPWISSPARTAGVIGSFTTITSNASPWTSFVVLTERLCRRA